MGVCKQWTGLLDWNTGLDYWTALNILRSCVPTHIVAWVHIMLMYMHLHVYNVHILVIQLQTLFVVL